MSDLLEAVNVKKRKHESVANGDVEVVEDQ
jgi:hypothetical protein